MSDDKRTITTTVFEQTNGGYGKDPSDPLPELLRDLPAWAERMLAKVPPEFRDVACVCLDDDGDSDWPHPQLSIWFDRLETDAEWATRKAAEAARAEMARVEQVRRERHLYETLKRKYAPTPQEGE